MPFLSDPVFIPSVKRNSGAKRRLINISCSEDRDVEVQIKEMEKPDWIDVEGVYPGQPLKFERGKPTSYIVNLNTTHKFFPKGPVKDECIRLTLSTEEVLEIQISIPEVVDTVEPFRGVFALDFGTTNSCYAFRGGTAKASKSLQQAKCSDEIPSLVYFHDVSDPARPRYSIGTEAVFDIRENSSRTYAYVLSAKRMLGQDRTLVMMDKLGGTRAGHRQEWHVEDVASFIIRELISRAEEDLGQKISQVVATFPPMFSRDRKEAIRRAIQKALEAGGVKVDDKSVVMDIDEANAAAFNYIYGPLLDDIRKLRVSEKSLDLLAYDFGGGTIDIALVGVKITYTPQGKISIETELKGLSGEALYGGDNVTLELFRILKPRMALAVAEGRMRQIEERKKAEEKAKTTATDDIWGAPPPKQASLEEEMFSREPEKKKEAAPPPPPVDPELVAIVNRENPSVYEGAVSTVVREKEVILEALETGRSVAEVVAAKERVRDLAARRVQQIEAALETLIPTRFTKYQDVDPFKEQVARSLFHEIWHEADALKIRLSGAEGQPRTISGVLRKVAHYGGVEPIVFNDLAFTMAQLEKRIDAKITETVRKARDLYRGSGQSGQGGIEMARSLDPSNLRVLLFGNSSNLPIVKRKFAELLGIPEQNIVHNVGELKKAVAAGACDEYGLRKAFGEGGLIHYKPVGFLDRLPCSVGLYHRELSFVGASNGFLPIFPRGTQANATRDLDEKKVHLLYPGIQELPIYVDHLDGSAPENIGYIDFTKPLPGGSDSSAFEQGTSGEFPVRFRLLPTREITATNLKTGQTYGMVLEKPVWVTEENPFSGMH
jgi:molecular chaperone DnaK (HSP70)